jgi:hypothetical protein
MAGGALEVTEISEVGSVPTLRVTNKSDLMAFLMAGGQLVGAKRNRVLNVRLMVPPSTSLDIPFSCVEAGHWHRRSAKFASCGSISHGKLRKMMSKQTHLGHRGSGTPTSDQMAVWSEVSRKLSAMGSASPSQALEQLDLKPPLASQHRRRKDRLMALLSLISIQVGISRLTEHKKGGGSKRAEKHA